MSDVFSWSVVPLENLAEQIDYGLTASATDSGNGPKFLRITDIQDDRVDWATVPLCSCTIENREKYALKAGDIVFARTGATTGKSFLVRSCPLGAIFASYLIRVRPSANVDPGYLAHYFQTSDYWRYVARSSTGTAQAGVNASNLKKLPVPLPPLEEQRCIAAILDKADTVRRKRQEAIALTEELLRSAFLEMFGDPVTNPKGWTVRKFSEVGVLDRGISKHRPRNASELLGGVYPLIQTGDVANCDRYIRSYTSTYSEIGLRQSRMWKAGTLCITIAANIAKTGILTFDACFPDSVVGFQPNNLSATEYVQFWLSFLQATLEATAPQSAQKNINLAILRNLDIPVPSIDLQQEFARRIEVNEQLKTMHRESLTQLNALFNSLLQRAFCGKLGTSG